jgi:hypothetical protein
MFTYDTTLSSNLALVRFEIGDTNEAGHYLEDETINHFLTSSIGQAVVSCIEYIITQLSIPDFRLDWMNVTNGQARSAFENMLKLKCQKYGISPGATITSSISHAHRADSYEMNKDGTYDVPDGA